MVIEKSGVFQKIRKEQESLTDEQKSTISRLEIILDHLLKENGYVYGLYLNGLGIDNVRKEIARKYIAAGWKVECWQSMGGGTAVQLTRDMEREDEYIKKCIAEGHRFNITNRFRIDIS